LLHRLTIIKSLGCCRPVPEISLIIILLRWWIHAKLVASSLINKHRDVSKKHDWCTRTVINEPIYLRLCFCFNNYLYDKLNCLVEECNFHDLHKYPPQPHELHLQMKTIIAQTIRMTFMDDCNLGPAYFLSHMPSLLSNTNH
jgi:hypothetical protein